VIIVARYCLCINCKKVYKEETAKSLDYKCSACSKKLRYNKHRSVEEKDEEETEDGKAETSKDL